MNKMRRLGFLWGHCRRCKEQKWIRVDFNDPYVSLDYEPDDSLCPPCAKEEAREWIETQSDN